VGGREVRRLTWVEENRASVPPSQDVVEDEQARGVLVQQPVRLPVGAGVEGEVAGPGGLAIGDRGDEGVLGQVLQRVVGPPLLPDRRGGLRGQRLAAGRARAVGRLDPGGIGQDQELVVQRLVKAAGQRIGG